LPETLHASQALLQLELQQNPSTQCALPQSPSAPHFWPSTLVQRPAVGGEELQVEPTSQLALPQQTPSTQ
jgi:hypothetical protein